MADPLRVVDPATVTPAATDQLAALNYTDPSNYFAQHYPSDGVVDPATGLVTLTDLREGRTAGSPTAHGVLSYALRWHGTRPALLWELEPRAEADRAVLRIPALDPQWSTTERRGDALLAEVDPPEGLDPLRIVADHPDIDPAMRRPGTAPDPSTGPPVADGGSFS